MAKKQHKQETPESLEAERFKNRKQAFNWLREQGYKVSQGKFYQDCLTGFPIIQRDGSVSRYQVMEYGDQLKLERAIDSLSPTSSPAPPLREHEMRKIKADADIAEMKAKRLRQEEDEEWLHAADAWATLAALMGTLRETIRYVLDKGQREIVHVAAGDQARSTEVFEHIDILINQAFNQVADGKINVIFGKSEDPT